MRLRGAPAAICGCVLASGWALGQAAPTAVAPLRVTAFGGVTGDFTGFGLSKNLSVTAGADVEFKPFFTLYPALEVRGSYPIQGVLARQENVLGGIRLARQSERFHPYGDVLFGQGAVNYGDGGAPDASGKVTYTRTVSDVYSLGGGLEYALGGRRGVKGDFQLQRYLTPAVAAGALYSKVFLGGVVYRFGFGGSVR